MKRTKYIDQVFQGKINRREMMASAAAFGVGVMIAPKLVKASGGPLTCLEWGGYDVADYFGPYMEKHGEAPNFSIFGGEEEALAKVRAGFAADVMHPCNYSVGRFVSAGLAEELDTSRLSNWKDIFPALQTADGVLVDGKVMMAPADWGNSSIAYRSDLIDDDFKANPSWSIFYDDAYAGKVSMLDNELVIQIGAMVGGMPYSEAYSLSGEALAEAAKTWGAKGVKTSRFMWSDPSEVQQAMASGEVIACYAWNDLVKNLKAEGIAVEYAVPKEGMFTWFCGLTMLNSGKADKALAYDFIDAWLSPETGKTLIEGSGYGHANMKSFEISNPDDVAAMGLSDPVAMMSEALLFRTPTDEVQNEQNKVWGDTKALTY